MTKTWEICLCLTLDLGEIVECGLNERASLRKNTSMSPKIWNLGVGRAMGPLNRSNPTQKKIMTRMYEWKGKMITLSL